MKKRPVLIVLGGDSWFVRYIDRKPGQRYLAAQFYAPDTSFDEVKAWVLAHPKLRLGEDPNKQVQTP